jgi:hypothetical protein
MLTWVEIIEPKEYVLVPIDKRRLQVLLELAMNSRDNHGARIPTNVVAGLLLAQALDGVD